MKFEEKVAIFATHNFCSCVPPLTLGMEVTIYGDDKISYLGGSFQEKLGNGLDWAPSPYYK